MFFRALFQIQVVPIGFGGTSLKNKLSPAQFLNYSAEKLRRLESCASGEKWVVKFRPYCSGCFIARTEKYYKSTIKYYKSTFIVLIVDFTINSTRIV